MKALLEIYFAISIDGEKIQVTLKKQKRIFTLRPNKFYFSEGKKFFNILSLKEQAGKSEEWLMGPLTGDCS